MKYTKEQIEKLILIVNNNLSCLDVQCDNCPFCNDCPYASEADKYIENFSLSNYAHQTIMEVVFNERSEIQRKLIK